MNQDGTLKRTPLYSCHGKAGARMVPFSGWQMPVQYQTGIIAEHLHTREKAGLFDICHMGEFYVRGENACEQLEHVVTRKLTGMEVGQCRYGMMLNEAGGVIDDLIVFRTGEVEYMLVVNAGTREKDFNWIKKHIDCELTDASDSISKIDIQGPLSVDVTASIFGEGIRGLKRFRFASFQYEDFEVLVSRTGYTGEEGFELFYPAEKAEVLWNRFLANEQVIPVGLGARDTLRLEKCYSLYGHELDEEHTPVEADLLRFVRMDKEFIGREAVQQQMEAGTEYKLVPFVSEGRRSPRAGFSIQIDGKNAGTATSGVFSPSMKQSIGMGYIRCEYAEEGREIVLTDGKRSNVKARIAGVPILK